MKFPLRFAALFVTVFLVVTAAWTFAQPQQNPSSKDVERGRYLVEEVAKCSECHTPRDSNNQLLRDRWLQGAPIWIRPVARVPNWADNAPALAGLPNYTDEQVRRVLEDGVGVQGMPIQPPMHIYHMHDEDAKAIIAYLRSVKGPLPSER